MLKLYSYFRSTAAYRVRIALSLKGLEHEVVAVHLLKDGGEHKQEAYLNRNPQGLVPMLETPEGDLSQSLSIIEYLEEAYPNAPSLLPESAVDRAHVRSIANHIACDIHPLNNLRVLQYLSNELEVTEEQKLTWYHHWLERGLSSVETKLESKPQATDFAFDDQPGLADICIVAQLYNAHRFDFDLSDYPNLRRIEATCAALPAFADSHPNKQIDYVE